MCFASAEPKAAGIGFNVMIVADTDGVSPLDLERHHDYSSTDRLAFVVLGLTVCAIYCKYCKYCGYCESADTPTTREQAKCQDQADAQLYAELEALRPPKRKMREG